MKKVFLIVFLAVMTSSVTGCDFFRAVAGRPVSEDIEKKKSEIIAEAASHKARVDSLRKVERKLADSLAVLDSLSKKKDTMMNPAHLGGLYATTLTSKYYIIIGSFMDISNAERLSEDITAKGYPASVIRFKNGYNAVGICPDSSIVGAYASLEKIKAEKFCPEGVWILVND